MNHAAMWIISAACSDASCGSEAEFVVDTLEEIEELVCECGYCVVALSVASFEPIYGKPGLKLVAPVPSGDEELLAA
jgi:hypothetical protein